MRLTWTKHGDTFTREYHASGSRGHYVIDLDPSPVDRWFVTVNGSRCVEDVYYVVSQDNAKAIAQAFEDTGRFALPHWPYARPDGRQPLVLLPEGPPRGAPHVLAAVTRQQPPMVRTPSEDPGRLEEGLVGAVSKLGLRPHEGDLDWLPWKSAVYALVDCVFSAQARYEATVLPMLKHRLQGRLPDRPVLKFTEFRSDVDSFGAARFERYASEVLTRQVLSGRLKVEVAYEAAGFLAQRGYETMAELQSLGSEPLERLVLGELVPATRGLGPTLGEYFLILIGDESRIKLDTWLVRFLRRELKCVPDPTTARQVFKSAAARLGTTAARLEHAIWRWESGSVR
jgi:hypothetical protein